MTVFAIADETLISFMNSTFSATDNESHNFRSVDQQTSLPNESGTKMDTATPKMSTCSSNSVESQSLNTFPEAICNMDNIESEVTLSRTDTRAEIVPGPANTATASDITLAPIPFQPSKSSLAQSTPTKEKRKKTSGKLKCTECSFETLYSSNLSRHKQTHQGNLKCTTCDRIFSSRRGLKEHSEVHKEKKVCDRCSATFGTSSGLYKHKRLIHSDKPKYICQVCRKKFMEKHHYVGHMNQHLNIKPHKCKHCRSNFQHEASLRKHENSCLGEAKHECEHCGKAMKDAQILAQHIKGAHNDTKHRCPCGKEFNWRASLYNHGKTCRFRSNFIADVHNCNVE